MGTRNLTAVYIDGEYKVAQYGQWDGYPEGPGADGPAISYGTRWTPRSSRRLSAIPLTLTRMS